MILQSKDGYFLRFTIEEIPEKKKNAVGVRSMKLGEKDELEAVYFTKTGADSAISYKEKEISLYG